MEFFYNVIKKNAIILDKKYFYNNEKNQIKAARFFYLSSIITVFFLFSRVGKIMVSFFAAICFFFSSSFFRALVAVFADFGIFYGIKYMVLNIPLYLLVLVVFVIFLIDLTLINTFLVCCPSISNRIKLLYGENFLKQQHYNSAFAYVKAASQMSKHIAIGVAMGVAGGALTNIYGEYTYSKNYQRYVESTLENPSVKIEPPKKGLFNLKLGR